MLSLYTTVNHLPNNVKVLLRRLKAALSCPDMNRAPMLQDTVVLYNGLLEADYLGAFMNLVVWDLSSGMSHAQLDQDG